MLSRLIKTTKYLTGWVGWTILYPMLRSESGQRCLVDIGLHVARKHPETALAVKREVEALLQDVIEGIEAVPAEEAVGPSIVSDVSGRHAPPKPSIVVEDAPRDVPPPRPRIVPRDGRGGIAELKTRLGLGKKS